MRGVARFSLVILSLVGEPLYAHCQEPRHHASHPTRDRDAVDALFNLIGGDERTDRGAVPGLLGPALLQPSAEGLRGRDVPQTGTLAGMPPAGAPNKPPAAVSSSPAKPVLPGLPDDLVAVVEGGVPAPVAPNAASGSPGAASGPPGAASGARAAPLREAQTGPVALTARVVRGPETSQQGLFLPFERNVGAAGFARDGDVLIVFDAARPFDLSAVQDDPSGARSSIQLLPEATILRLQGRRADQIKLRRLPGGWLVEPAGPQADNSEDIEPSMTATALRFPVASPGRTVVVPDPRTGGNLLVGTILDGQDAVRRTQHRSAATIEQTIQGVVVTPLSDRLELRPATGAFLLYGIAPDAFGATGSALELDSADNGISGRIMSLEPGSPLLLERRSKEAKAEAAAAGADGRATLRLYAAEDALAMGDAIDAETIIHVAMAEDARTVKSERTRLVASAAALLDHHPEPASLLDDPATPAHSELGLWRGLKLAGQNPVSPEAARLIAENLTLLDSYPAPLRSILLPLAAESLVRGGTDTQAGLIDRLPEEPALDFARALLADRRGHVQAALAALDRLASGRNLVLADNAAEQATRIRERSHDAHPKELADRLEAHLLDARIAGHEVDSRFHLADLRIQAGQWQKALDLLRETDRLYPEQDAKVRSQAAEVFRKLVNSPLAMGDAEALDQAATIESNANMLPSGPDGTRVSLFLAARLSSLDLPERAAPIVQQMMRAAAPGSGRAQLGLSLATMDLQQDDLDGAMSALRESDPGDLPPERQAPRLLVMARALAGEGKIDQALAAIVPLDTDAALDLKASLLARAGDWAAATDSLSALFQRHLPASGKLDAAGQDLLLRLASTCSRTADKSRIAQLRSVGAGRFGDPGKAAMFDLLTSDQSPGKADPAREQSELAALRHASAAVDTIAQ